MRVLVTGASGFIGSYLMEFLSQAGHEVMGLTRSPLEKNKKQYVVCDLTRFTIQEHFDIIIHTAAKCGIQKNNLADFVNDNIEGTRHLLRYASEAGCKILYLSTTSCFGNIRQGELSEDTEMNNPGYYGLTKYIAEKLVLESEVPSISFILPGVVGKNSHNPWLMRVARDMLEGKKVECYAPESLFNNVVHVHTVALCIHWVIENNLFCNKRVLLGSSNAVKKYDMLLRLKGLLESQSEIKIVQSSTESFLLNVNRAKNLGLPLSTIEDELIKLAHGLCDEMI